MKYSFTTIVLLYGFICSSHQQKSGKNGGGVSTSQAVKALGNPVSSHGHGHGQPVQYASSPQYAPSPYQGNYNSIGGGGAEKVKYAQLLSDTRQLNGDGTINFQYAADNGLQQGETVDPDGTRRGFYSYPGADGKPITVKYTAGKNGFIAEGAHLPKQPQVPAHSERDEVSYKPSEGHLSYDDGKYRPQSHGSSHHAGPSRQQHYRPQGGHAPQQYSPPAPSPQHYEHSQGVPQTQYHQGPRVSPQGHGGGFYGGDDFGPVNYGVPSHSPAQQKHSNSPPPPPPKPQQPYLGVHGSPGHGQGAVHNAFNPYQGSPAGPYAGQFDLGNGGQFSIDFNPGQPQEVPFGGNFGGHPGHQRY